MSNYIDLPSFALAAESAVFSSTLFVTDRKIFAIGSISAECYFADADARHDGTAAIVRKCAFSLEASDATAMTFAMTRQSR